MGDRRALQAGTLTYSLLNECAHTGANCTYTIEGMMGDRRALQAGTSHNLGDNFAKVRPLKKERGKIFYHYLSCLFCSGKS